MKLGNITPFPEDNDFSKWCPFDVLESGDYQFIFDYAGSCPHCLDGTAKLPDRIMVEYLRDTEGGVHHVFRTLEIVRCAGCGVGIDNISVLCPSRQAGIDVTTEFKEIRK